MVLNRQLECGFRKGSPSLINTFFYLLDGPLAGMPVTVTDWKRCLYVFLNGKTGKLHFTSISEPIECLPPPRMKLFGNQQLECLQGYIFSRQKHINILDPPSHQKKSSLPHNFHSFTNFSRYLEVLGIWMYLFENITLFFVHFAGLGTFTRFPHSIHTSMLEYASAGPCTLHPMRFPEATFFLATYLYIYLF